MMAEILAFYLLVGLFLNIRAAGELLKTGHLDRGARADLVYGVFFWITKYLFKVK